MKYIKIILRRMILKGFKLFGFTSPLLHLYASGIVDELLVNSDQIPLSRRIWAWKHGFLAQRLDMYGLDDENYKEYLSDFDYYRIYPLNNEFSKWIDDKLTLKYTLSKYDEYLPAYYAENRADGVVLPLMDWPDAELLPNTESIVALIRRYGKLAAKQQTGSAGEGFYQLEYRDGQYYANGMHLEDTAAFIRGLEGYLITELVVQGSHFDRIYANATHTLRIQTVKVDNEEPTCLFSFMRWGSKTQNYYVSHSVSGIAAAVDVETGIIDHAFYADKQGHFHDIIMHPDTNASLIGKVPQWEKIVEKCLEIHDYLNELEYIGFDVVIMEDSFKIIEINSHSGIRTVQHAIPFWKDKRCAAYFSRYINK